MKKSIYLSILIFSKWATELWNCNEFIIRIGKEGGDVKVPHDTVAEELKKIAEISREKSENLAMALAVYMLGFSSYIGFSKLVDEKEDIDENFLNRIYAYARGIGF